MTTFKSGDNLHPNWETEAKKGYFIDLRNAKDSFDIIRSAATVIHGQDSAMGGLVNPPNLNWFNDIAYDFFLENWGKSKRIQIAGGQNALNIDTLGFIELLDCVNGAFTDALVEKTRFGVDREEVFIENIQNYTLWVVMN